MKDIQGYTEGWFCEICIFYVAIVTCLECKQMICIHCFKHGHSDKDNTRTCYRTDWK